MAQQQLLATSDLIKWCDEQVEKGHELGMGWEGGGDSGWCWFTIDGKQVSDNGENPQILQLLDLMYDTLDYGSWAGEFSATGDAIYDSEQKAFVGVDYYGEDETVVFNYPINITVPKNLWFDSIEVNFEQEDPIIDVAFIIRNGFLTDEHTKVAKDIQEHLEIEVEKAISAYHNLPDSTEYISMWQNTRISRNEFTEESDNLVYVLDELNIGTRTNDEKDIYLELITREDEY